MHRHDDDFLQILCAPMSVFTASDMVKLWEMPDRSYLRKKLHRYASSGKLHAVRKGIYAKDPFYNRFELATRIFKPSYVSLESVLGPAGIVTPRPRDLFVVSYLTRKLRIEDQTYCFRKIRNSALQNWTGIDVDCEYPVALPERAFLDLLYLNGDCRFHNLAELDWNVIEDILPIYGGHRRVERLANDYRQQAGRG